MTHWVRFAGDDGPGFGKLASGAGPAEGTGAVEVHEGDMYAGCAPTGATVDLADVELLTPCQPTKMIGIWNNFHAAAAKNGLVDPGASAVLLQGSIVFPGRGEHHPGSARGRGTGGVRG